MKLSFAVVALTLIAAPTPLLAQSSVWPLEESVKSPTRALSIPTRLDPVGQSLTAILDAGGQILTAYVGTTGPIVTVRLRTSHILCLVTGANPATDQNVATSQCYALN